MKAGRYFWLLVFVAMARAQSGSDGIPASFYADLAPGRETIGTTPASHVTNYGLGIGSDLMFSETSPFGVNFNLEGLVPGTGQASSTVGLFSAGAVVHFIRAARVDPFLVGGYALVFNDFAASGYDVGGGANIWCWQTKDGKPWGLRMEFRYEGARPSVEPYTHGGPYTHYLGVRFGFVWGHRPGGS